MTSCQKCRDRNRETSGGFLCIYCFDWTDDDVEGVCPRCGLQRCVYVPPGEHARSVARIRDFIEKAKEMINGDNQELFNEAIEEIKHQSLDLDRRAATITRRDAEIERLKERNLELLEAVRQMQVERDTAMDERLDEIQRANKAEAELSEVKISHDQLRLSALITPLIWSERNRLRERIEAEREERLEREIAESEDSHE